MVLSGSQQANVSRSGGSPLRRRVIIGFVTVALILCAVIVLFKSSNNTLSYGKQQKDDHGTVAYLSENNFLLVAHGFGELIHVPLNGEQHIPVSMTFKPRELDHDCTESRFYAISYETNQISSANYNGTDGKLFIGKDIVFPSDLAVDWISRRLYWADREKGTIEVASLENPTVRTVLIYEDLEPYRVAVDPLRSKLFWLNTVHGDTIEWSNVDGSERQILVSPPQISDVRSIKVSTSTGELCYLDRDLKRIQCIDPLSNGIRTIVSNLTEPREIVITDELFYWIEQDLHTIESIYSNGVRQEPFTMPGSPFFTGMTSVTNNCPLFNSPCATNNGDCPENTICLVNADASAGKSCIVKKRCIVHPNPRGCSQLIVDN